MSAPVRFQSASDVPFGIADLDGDGRGDIVRFRWNGKDAILIDEGRRFPWPANPSAFDWNAFFNRAFNLDGEPGAWNPIRSGWGSYTILIDLDGDGVFDGPGDLRCSVFDLNGDGDPEVSFQMSGPNVFIFTALNGERDLMDTTYLFNGGGFGRPYREPDRKPGQIGPMYVTNYHGSGFHLTNDPGEAIWPGRDLAERIRNCDPRRVWWESPSPGTTSTATGERT